MTHKQTLVVDDCRMNTLLLKHILAKLGVRADSAGDGDEAVRLAEANTYSLVFLDVMLPTIDGFEVCRRIRALDKPIRPRIYFLTALGEAYSPEAANGVDADGAFFKPIVPSQISEVVREAFAAAERQVAETQPAEFDAEKEKA